MGQFLHKNFDWLPFTPPPSPLWSPSPILHYERFIEGFLKISKPMTELLEKDKKFEWTPACEASFQELKN
jgi:hypothetical protein